MEPRVSVGFKHCSLMTLSTARAYSEVLYCSMRLVDLAVVGDNDLEGLMVTSTSSSLSSNFSPSPPPPTMP